MNIKVLVSDFVIRRAFRVGKVTRGDVADAFVGAFSPTRISQKLSEIAESSSWVSRQGNALVPAPGVNTPVIAGEEDLLENLVNGKDDFAFTGLRPEELPLHKADWINNAPPRPGDLQRLVNAIIGRQLVQIKYTSLRKGDKGERRLIAPVGFERMADQWRFIGFDLRKEEFTPRAYVFARILEVDILTKAIPKAYSYSSFTATHTYMAKLNPLFTDAQRRAIENELNIHQGKLRLQPTHLFEFMRRFGNQEVSENAVWPLLEKVIPR